jgi:hypothetical protein
MSLDFPLYCIPEFTRQPTGAKLVITFAYRSLDNNVIVWLNM